MDREEDEEQLRLMEELCILVDESDSPVGYASKKKCHLMSEIEKGLLHRAFSLFVFNAEGQLLLQQRAAEKITFPSYWTNSVCSHPLHQVTDPSYHILGDEREGVLGVKRAACRKVVHELGVPRGQVTPDMLTFVTRILYKASSDPVWGEHEVDYCLVLRLAPGQPFDVNPNPNEVSSVAWVSLDDLQSFLQSKRDTGLSVTPWFQLIVDTFITKWWRSLLQDDLASHIDEATVHKLG